MQNEEYSTTDLRIVFGLSISRNWIIKSFQRLTARLVIAVDTFAIPFQFLILGFRFSLAWFNLTYFLHGFVIDFFFFFGFTFYLDNIEAFISVLQFSRQSKMTKSCFKIEHDFRKSLMIMFCYKNLLIDWFIFFDSFCNWYKLSLQKKGAPRLKELEINIQIEFLWVLSFGFYLFFSSIIFIE